MRPAKSALALALIISFSISLSAQTEPEEFELPPNAMHEVVGRVLRDKFEPGDSPRTVELYEDGLRWEWLPPIRNVFFVLASKQEIESREIEVYFFKKKARRDANGEIFIDFGFGDPFCSATGTTWSYKEKDGPASIHAISAGWGMGCCKGSAH